MEDRLPNQEMPVPSIRDRVRAAAEEAELGRRAEREHSLPEAGIGRGIDMRRVCTTAYEVPFGFENHRADGASRLIRIWFGASIQPCRSPLGEPGGAGMWRFECA